MKQECQNDGNVPCSHSLDGPFSHRARQRERIRSFCKQIPCFNAGKFSRRSGSLVQDPNEAEYGSMPRAAIMTGCVDFVLPANRISGQLAHLIRTKKHLGTDLGKSSEESLRRILSHLRARTGHDFSLYKRSTVLRRVARRMQVQRVDNFDDYYNLLRGNAEEAQSLFADLLISVTTFFRDPSAFDCLERLVIPRVFDMAGPDEPIRVWVPGCATGEEAYSIGMLLLEEAGRRDDRPTIQIFATDLDAGALATAREGCYLASIVNDVGEERLKRFFTTDGDQYRVKRELRDIVLFASHSLLKDPPFSKLHLISCRNLLIYLDRELQQQVCQTFQCALRPEGYLFLGSSETAEHPPGLFRTLDRDSRIFQSTRHHGERASLIPRLSLTPPLLDLTPPLAPAQPSAARPNNRHAEALEQLAPPSVLVDRDFRVLHLSETAGRYLQPSAGQLSQDITELVRSELRFDLRMCLHRAFEQGTSELSLPISVKFNGHPVRVYLQVRSQSAPEEPKRAIVFFIEGGPVEELGATPAPPGDGEQIRSLQEELELTRSRLRSSREEFDAATEELRAANEELQSINEEYRSTAEELETSKEELQSINEELQTVNSELKVKLEGVSRVNSDLQNLMSATDVGTLFLDNALAIKRFTPPVANLFNITPNDEGRPITDFTHHLDYPEFAEDARSVLRDLTPIEREVARGENWFLTRLRPYRTVDDRIDGVVVTFIDVTERRNSAEALRQGAERQKLLLQELSHRVKNTLAVVQAIARRSFREDSVTSDALDRFSGRIGALAHAHDLLIGNDWRGANLRELAETQVGAVSGSAQITISGPDVILPPHIATPFGLILHELATNAMKYGALSMPQGTVSASWTLSSPGAKGLKFIWREAGVEIDKTPECEGFGSQLIDGGLPEAKVERVFGKDGLTCTIAFDLIDVGESERGTGAVRTP